MKSQASDKSILTKENLYRVLFYLGGMAVLALGIVLNTKSGLGVSPIISVSYTASELIGINFGNATFAWYATFVLVEIIIHTFQKKKNMIIPDLLQLVVSLIFTRFMNVFVNLIPNFVTDFDGQFIGSMTGRIIILIIAIILTGIGAAVTLNMNIIPNPGDGIVAAIASVIKKSVGFTKNCVDISCVTISVLLGLLVRHSLIGIGIGTVMAMIGVGRVVALWNKLLKAPMAKLAGIEE